MLTRRSAPPPSCNTDHTYVTLITHMDIDAYPCDLKYSTPKISEYPSCNTQGYALIFMDTHGDDLVLFDAVRDYLGYLVLLDTHGYAWIRMDTRGHSRVLKLLSTLAYWIRVDAHGY